MAQVHWTLGAASDLEEAAAFLSAVSDEAASALVERILTAVAGLEQLPRIGRVVPEYEMDQLRELIVRDYRVIYILDAPGESVRIYAIHHGSRDLSRLLGDRPWEEIP